MVHSSLCRLINWVEQWISGFCFYWYRFPRNDINIAYWISVFKLVIMLYLFITRQHKRSVPLKLYKYCEIGAYHYVRQLSMTLKIWDWGYKSYESVIRTIVIWNANGTVTFVKHDANTRVPIAHVRFSQVTHIDCLLT